MSFKYTTNHKMRGREYTNVSYGGKDSQESRRICARGNALGRIVAVDSGTHVFVRGELWRSGAWHLAV